MAIVVRRALGLDVGSHRVKAVELRQTVNGMEVGGLAQILVDDPADSRSLGERLLEMLQAHKLPTDAVVCAVPSDRLTRRRLEFPFRDRRRLEQAVPLAVEDELPFETDDYLIDWELLGGDRQRAEVLAAVVGRSAVGELISLTAEAGVAPRIIEAEGPLLGALAGWLELSGAQALIDLGHRKTTVCVCSDGRPLAARAFPIGGRMLTEALARDLGTTLATAEAHKCEQGVFGRRAESAEAVIDRLLRELVRSLGAFEPALAAQGAGRLDGVVLVGGGAHLPGIEAWLGERLGLPVKRAGGPPGPSGEAFVAGGDPALFGPAAALALRGTLRARTRTNFRKDEFAVRFDLGEIGREWAWTGVLALVALLLAGVVAGTSIVLQSRRADAVRGEVARLYGEAFPGRPTPSNAFGAMRAAVDGAQGRADFLGVYRGNLSALDVLTEISSRVPESLDVAFEELAIDRQVVRLRGRSRSFQAVDQLKKALEDYAPFSQIQISESQRDPKSKSIRFSVTISLATQGGA